MSRAAGDREDLAENRGGAKDDRGDIAVRRGDGAEERAVVAEDRAASWAFRRLYFGQCAACRRAIENGEHGWHDAGTRRILCTTCRRAPLPDPVRATVARPPLHRVRTRTSSFGNLLDVSGWRQLRADQDEGAVGRLLYDNLTEGEVTLAARRPPGSGPRVSHVIVAPSGIWIVDVQRWTGRLGYRRKGRTRSGHLVVDGQDVTFAAARAYSAVVSIAELIHDYEVPIDPVLAVIAPTFELRTAFRFRAGLPILHERMWICPPRLVPPLVKGPGPVPIERVHALARLLDAALPPA